ncbi:hypothetical protein [Caballeronia sp. SBC2]|uniref:hypothetical protein n=1 Tax=Caballeronia sp. SBC2 TaxID=2705547 RepID=UPI0013E1E09B|nr:hypothetical protein [Caballeronia sp. SBC2]QIE30287.1 hypothetical protein SBC2_83630 [Caballeronia sp. SBC2]
MLNLSFRPTVTLLGFVEVGNISGLKVWLSLLAVLIYAFLRYQFDDQTQTEWAALHVDYANWRRQAVRRHLERAVRRYFLRDRPVDWIVNFEDFIDTDISARMQEDGPAKDVDDLSVNVVDSGERWKGRAGISFHANWATKSYGRYGGSTYQFDLPIALRASTTFTCALRSVLYSKGAVDVYVPHILASAAMLTSLFKLGFSLGAIR